MYYNSSLSLVAKPIRIHYVQKIRVAYLQLNIKLTKLNRYMKAESITPNKHQSYFVKLFSLIETQFNRDIRISERNFKAINRIFLSHFRFLQKIIENQGHNNRIIIEL